MNAHGFGGSVAGIPVRGGIVSIDSADATTIINAASGLMRTTASMAAAGARVLGKGLIVGGGFALATAFLAPLVSGMSITTSPKMPIFSLARIKTLSREFLGICVTDIFDCNCDGENLRIPTHTINKIKFNYCGGADYSGYDVELIDGSRYSRCKSNTHQLSFLTICGDQNFLLFCKVDIPNAKRGFFSKQKKWIPHKPSRNCGYYNSIEGVTVNDLIDLRHRLRFAFENNLDAVINTIGREEFAKYFVLS